MPRCDHSDGLRALKARGRFAALVVPVVALVLGANAPRARADVYYTTDADGTVHFTSAATPGAKLFVAAGPIERLRTEPRPGVRARLDRDGQYEDLVARYAKQYDVDPALVRAVIRAESGFNRHAVSPKGARGLMQLMPATARKHGCWNSFDADDNIHAGVEHLRSLLDAHGNNLPRALAAYNAGSGAVERHHGIPPYAETTHYVAAVLRYRREDLRRQRLRPTTLAN
jgi:soluble lytic murein transglycosylase-like protein